MPDLGLLFVFRILDLSYMINTVIHTNPNSWYTFPSFFVSLRYLQINERGCEGNTEAEFQAEIKKKWKWHLSTNKRFVVQRRSVFRRQMRENYVGDVFGETDCEAGLQCLTNVVLWFLGTISCFSGMVCWAADLTHCIKLDHLFRGRVIIP